MSDSIQEVYRTRPLFDAAMRRWLRIAALAVVGVLVLRWAVLDAVFLAETPEACREAHGACWAVITSQWKLVLLGTYPLPLIWRPVLATGILLAAFAGPLLRPTLGTVVASWGTGVLLSIFLLDGRPLGLAQVETREWGGLPLTLLLSEGAMLLAFPLGLAAALARQSGGLVLRSLALVTVECLRGVPLVSLLFFATLVLPLFVSGFTAFDKLAGAAAAIILFQAAYISEVIRGGLLTVQKGQFEAAKALGLRWGRMHRLIVLPQALRACAPSLVNQAVGTVKDTSLIAVLGIFDLMNATRLSIVDVRWHEYFVEAYLFIGLSYFAICTTVSFLGMRLAARLHAPRLAREAQAQAALRAAAVTAG